MWIEESTSLQSILRRPKGNQEFGSISISFFKKLILVPVLKIKPNLGLVHTNPD
jgi:hypothetical protein